MIVLWVDKKQDSTDVNCFKAAWVDVTKIEILMVSGVSLMLFLDIGNFPRQK